MTKTLRKTLADSKSARWTALLIVSFTMMWGYFLTDAMSPLMTMLEDSMNWSSKDFGVFNWSYMWFNVFLFFLLFGGYFLDKMGVRLSGLIACILMIVGAGIKYFAVEYISPDTEPLSLFGIRLQVLVACIGYATFAVGTENCGVIVSKIINKWFAGKELATAMGIQVAIARLGTALALCLSPIIVSYFKVSTPLLFSIILLIIGLFAYLVFCVMDTKRDKEISNTSPEEASDIFKLSDIKVILFSKGFWIIALLCLTFYSAVFPFLKFSSSLMENKYNVSTDWAGWIPTLLPLGNLIMTPVFGRIYDKIGKGATIMIIGSVILIVVHVLFAIPWINDWWFAAIVVLFLGVAFSLVPSAMWPSVPKIIPQKQLGSAYALIFWVQNIGLGFVPLGIGWVLDKYCVIGTRMIEVKGQLKEVNLYDYTLPMLIFAAIGIVALLLALMLKHEDSVKGYGLEQSNLEEPI